MVFGPVRSKRRASMMWSRLLDVGPNSCGGRRTIRTPVTVEAEAAAKAEEALLAQWEVFLARSAEPGDDAVTQLEHRLVALEAQVVERLSALEDIERRRRRDEADARRVAESRRRWEEERPGREARQRRREQRRSERALELTPREEEERREELRALGRVRASLMANLMANLRNNF